MKNIFFISYYMEESTLEDGEEDANANVTSDEDVMTAIDPKAGVEPTSAKISNRWLVN